MILMMDPEYPNNPGMKDWESQERALRSKLATEGGKSPACQKAPNIFC
jgi:hypothetical protein